MMSHAETAYCCAWNYRESQTAKKVIAQVYTVANSGRKTGPYLYPYIRLQNMLTHRSNYITIYTFKIQE